MCTNITHATDVSGSAYAAGAWLGVSRAVVSFDHPAELAVDHALCIDFRAGNGDPSARVAVELDRASARALATSILAALHDEEDGIA